MHPAFSVIFFTVASGAGYGLLALLGLLVFFGVAPASLQFGVAGLGVALALVTAGLVSSTAHLSHPERALRAFSQWRSSWLSRGGIAAVLTFAPALLLGLGWAIQGTSTAWVGSAGLASAVASGATVGCTGMIYASLKPVPQWRGPYTTLAYLILSLATGATLLNAVLQM